MILLILLALACAVLWNRTENFAPCIGNVSYARRPTANEEPLFQRLRQKAKEFVNHVRSKYPDDPRTQKLSSWNGEILASTKPNTGATYFSRTGCIIINPTYMPKSLRGSGFDPEGRLLTRLLHELAHTSSSDRKDPHDAVFYGVHRWFLRIATEELGWNLEVNCRVCSYSRLPCTAAAICPKCRWVDKEKICVPLSV